MFELVAGHESAFGVELNLDNIGILEEKINEALKEESFEMIYDVDFVIPFNSTDKGILRDITDLSSVWGKDIQEPKFVISNIDPHKIDINVIGKNEDTISFIHKGIYYIAFKQNKEILNKLNSSKYFEVVGKASINEYKGNKDYQIIIEDFNIY